jgi:hypothetical protein
MSQIYSRYKRSNNRRLTALPLTGLPDAIVWKSRRLARLRDVVLAALDAQEARHIVGINADKNKLVIFADSSAWCTRLRYRAPEIEAAAERLLRTCPQVTFRVQPRPFHEIEPAGRALSSHARATIAAGSRTISDPELAAALRRLAGEDG